MKSKRHSAGFAMLASASALAILVSTAASAIDVSGRVSAGAAQSLQGATVRINELNLRATTGSDGIYRFLNVPAGTYTLTISYVGASPVTREIKVTDADSVIDVNLGSDEAGLEEIVVTGQRGSLNSSLSKQRASDNVANFLSADAAGNFPDQNVTEAVRRIVGLSVENDQGEGRYVIIRGIDPNLSSSSIGGVRLPSPESGDRKVALDVIPSELLETVEVTKSLTPDMDADAIGGNVDIKTLSGFDKKDLFVKAKVEGSYNRQQDDISPKFGLTVADQLSDKFAVAGSISYYNRKFGTDDREVDGGWINEDDDGTEIDALIPDELELRDYVVERRRLGAALNLDYRPSEDTDLYLRTLYSNFKDTEQRQRMELKLNKGVFDLDNSSVEDGYVFLNDIDVDRDLKDRIESQKILSLTAGGETRFNNFTATYSASYAHAEEAEPDRLDTDFKDKDFAGGVNFQDLLAPQSAFLDQDGLDQIRDLSRYEIDAIEYTDGLAEDDQIALKFDLAYDTFWGENPLQLKWGAKARLRDKSYDTTFIVYEDVGDATAADFPTAIDLPIDYAMGDAGLNRDTIRDYFNANRNSFSVNADDSAIGDQGTEYGASEDIYAAYMMGKLDIGALRIVGGLRYEYTDFATTANHVEIGGDEPIITPISFDKNYDYFLPSLNMRYEPTENVVMRLAYFRSVVRPNISKMVPTGTIEFDDGERSGELGNPSLLPMWAHNIDASLEWYPNNDAVLSVGVFYKDIRNFVVDRTFEDVRRNGIFFDELVQPQNGDSAEVKGFEANYQQALTFLPGLLSGLIVGVNYTYVDSEATIEEEGVFRAIPLPKTSKNVANLVLGYEKGPISLRAAMTYRDEYLDELNAEGFGDRYVLSHTQWDFSAAYEIFKDVKIYGEVSNANDEPFNAVFRTDGGDYLAQHEQYDWTANFGIKAKF